MSITPSRPKWPGTMTDRQRFRRQMHYEPVDRCFNMEFGYWDENFHTWPLFTENSITNNAEADVFFNFDRIKTISGKIWLNPAFDEKVIEVSSTRKIIRNREGLLAEVPADGHDSIPHFIKSSIETPDDWQKLKAERLNVDDPARIIDVEAIKELHPEDRDYPLGVACGSMIGKVRDLLTFEGLAYAVYDYPEMVEDIVETCCVIVEHSLDQLLGCGIQFDLATGWEDICFKNGPIVSPEFFRDVVMPRYKRISKRLRAADIDIWYTDCDGDVRPILPYLLEGGINCLFPFEVNSAGHPGAMLDEFGPELRIMGGVDKMQLGAGRDAIKQCLERLAPWVHRGGYIPFCDHRCPPNVAPDDYLYYLDLKEQMFGRLG